MSPPGNYQMRTNLFLRTGAATVKHRAAHDVKCSASHRAVGTLHARSALHLRSILHVPRKRNTSFENGHICQVDKCGLFRGSGCRIRTLTNGVRVRCATITQTRYDALRRNAYLIICNFSQKSSTNCCFPENFFHRSCRRASRRSTSKSGTMSARRGLCFGLNQQVFMPAFLPPRTSPVRLSPTISARAGAKPSMCAKQ